MRPPASTAPADLVDRIREGARLSEAEAGSLLRGRDLLTLGKARDQRRVLPWTVRGHQHRARLSDHAVLAEEFELTIPD